MDKPLAPHNLTRHPIPGKLHLSIFYIFLLFVSSCLPTGKDLSGRNQGQKDSAVELDFDVIQSRGYITALIENSSTGLFLYKGRTMGYEYELLKMFADSMGLNLKLNICSNTEDAIKKLNEGEGDIIAYNLTVTRERKERINFTVPHTQVKQVLVQRKPENWREMKLHEIDAKLIRNPVDLIGKEVWVRYQSAFGQRMAHLSEEVGGEILIIEDFPDVNSEDLIRKVADGDIMYTVADENVALVNAAYYPHLDVSTPLSFPQQIAWGVRKNADSLLHYLDEWITMMQRLPDYYTVYDKYFKSTRSSVRRRVSEYSTVGGGKLSPYDDFIREKATEIGWDWRLLAAQIYIESKFNPTAVSWMGAVGLMQVMPATAQMYGVSNLKSPVQNLHAGTQQIKWLQSIWQETIRDEDTSIKFILASYNVGQGHVFDARRLALKYGENQDDWDVVSKYLIKKSKPEYFEDPVVEFGYCRGQEPVDYVRNIFQYYENYQKLYSNSEDLTQNIDQQF